MENNNPDTLRTTEGTDATPKGVTQTDPLAANTDSIDIAPEPADTDDQDMAGKLKAARDESAKRRMKVKELTEQVDALTAENDNLKGQIKQWRTAAIGASGVMLTVHPEARADFLAKLDDEQLGILYATCGTDLQDLDGVSETDSRFAAFAKAAAIVKEHCPGYMRANPQGCTPAQLRVLYRAGLMTSYSTPETARMVHEMGAPQAPVTSPTASPLARAISR